MASNIKDKPLGYSVAGWVEHECPPSWRISDVCEWTYKRAEGDLTVFARNPAEALRTIEAHGFTNLNPKCLVQTGGTLAEHLANSNKQKPIE